jgi:hypothetical protein
MLQERKKERDMRYILYDLPNWYCMLRRGLNASHIVLSFKLFIYIVDGRKYRCQLNDHFVRYNAYDVLRTNRRKCGKKLEIKSIYITKKDGKYIHPQGQNILEIHYVRFCIMSVVCAFVHHMR